MRAASLNHRASAVFGPDEVICALAARDRFDGDAASGKRTAASAGVPGIGRRTTVVGSTITFAPSLTRSYRSTTSSLVSRIQPDETRFPIVSGLLVP